MQNDVPHDVLRYLYKGMIINSALLLLKGQKKMGKDNGRWWLHNPAHSLCCSTLIMNNLKYKATLSSSPRKA